MSLVELDCVGGGDDVCAHCGDAAWCCVLNCVKICHGEMIEAWMMKLVGWYVKFKHQPLYWSHQHKYIEW